MLHIKIKLSLSLYTLYICYKQKIYSNTYLYVKYVLKNFEKIKGKYVS